MKLSFVGINATMTSSQVNKICLTASPSRRTSLLLSLFFSRHGDGDGGLVASCQLIRVIHTDCSMGGPVPPCGSVLDKDFCIPPAPSPFLITFRKTLTLNFWKPSGKNCFEGFYFSNLQKKIVLMIWNPKSFRKKSFWRIGCKNPSEKHFFKGLDLRPRLYVCYSHIIGYRLSSWEGS